MTTVAKRVAPPTPQQQAAMLALYQRIEAYIAFMTTVVIEESAEEGIEVSERAVRTIIKHVVNGGGVQ